MAAVSKSGQTLRDVSEKLRTREICMTAVRDNEMAFQYVPSSVRGGAKSAKEFLAFFEGKQVN